jgi:5'-nucleotidase
VSYLLADEKPGHINTLVTGRSIDLLRPLVDGIFIEDIACSLAKLNRFTGYTSRIYTVAEHCLLGLDYLPAGERFEFLLHDATEAYLGDVSGPLKALEGMESYRGLESVWACVIAERFGLKKKTPGGVRVTDQRMLVTEMRDLRGRRPLWGDKVKPFPCTLPAHETSATLLEQRFLEAFAHLAGQTEGAKR